MKKQYIMLLAAALMAGNAVAEEAGAWRNINYKAQTIAHVPGWSGVITGAGNGVAEMFYSAGLAYQVIPDAPAGQYTLTANAFYRATGAPDAYKLHKDGKEVIKAHIFIGETRADVKSLFEGMTDAEMLENGEYKWGVVPNSMEEANAAFEAGKYANTVTANHPGGDLVIGIRNLGSLDLLDEWLCFDNFKLVGPNGEVKLENGDFAKGIAEDGWDFENISGSAKGRDSNKNGAVFSKTNASPYNHSQTLELPAGKYRFRVNAFFRVRNGNDEGSYVPMKGQWEIIEGETAYDIHKAGKEDPKDNAYIYINAGEKETGILVDDINTWPSVVIDGEDYSVEGAQTAIKCIFDEELNKELGRFPDCESKTMTYIDGDGNEQHHWWESGSNRESAFVFVNTPELYENVVEYELKEAGKLTFGIRKDLKRGDGHNGEYWQPSFDYRLEYFDPNYKTPSAGVENVAVEAENAVVEYYNLNGVRVANPENGLYIVKEGNKVSKKFFRK